MVRASAVALALCALCPWQAVALVVREGGRHEAAGGLAASVREAARPTKGGFLTAVVADIHELMDSNQTSWVGFLHHGTRAEPAPGSFRELFLLSVPELTAATITWIVLSVVVAFLYHTHKAVQPINPELNNEVEQEKLKTWQVGWFHCMFCGDPALCFWSCCCPAVRAAHSLDLMQLAPFWMAFALIYALMVLDFLTVEMSFIVLTLVFTYYRRQIRKAFDMDTGVLTVVTDCCCYCWCQPCLIAQEALHIRKAAECGHPAVKKPEEIVPPSA